MSFANNEKTTLFTQLSEKQEEIVSGGNGRKGNSGLFFPGNVGNNFGVSTTNFLEQASVLDTVSQSGPGGSVAGGSSIEKVIKTSGVNALGLGDDRKY